MSAIALPGRCTPVGLNSVPLTFRKIVKFARSEGWLLGKDGHGHVLLVGPSGQRLRIPSTGKMNGHRSKNYQSLMRHHGVPGA